MKSLANVGFDPPWPWDVISSADAMLPAAVPRGDAPKGVRLERHPDVEDLSWGS